MSSQKEAFTLTRTSERVWKIVESDPWKQYPFIYVLIGWDKIILIDSGCGTQNLHHYILQNKTLLNPHEWPILLIVTHTHFDHIGGVTHFCGQEGCLGICCGSNNKTFSNNYETNSLALAFPGAKVKNFEVSQWLNDGDLIYLDDKDKQKSKSLEVIFTPGHTPDSIALYFHGGKRLFVGDSLYPFTAIHLDCLGSNLPDYVSSMNKLNKFLETVKSDSKIENLGSLVLSAPDPRVIHKNIDSPVAVRSDVTEFLGILGLDSSSVTFDVGALIDLCDGSVESALNLYLSNDGHVGDFVPAAHHNSPTSDETPKAPLDLTYKSYDDVRLSCGHVEDNLSASSLSEILTLIGHVQAGLIHASHVDSGYGEFSQGIFTLLLPMKEIYGNK
eukprot:TRINITY_DN6883_c0_g1_i1.p1 TRINITY_DN6883_c0_g1~~TRINITY_DN6883_c0_g1_i1.p1  ORF type:complete len:387 (-),score=66.95 TRINITY_DN6883_c0_g1_i1:86-1246(-)